MKKILLLTAIFVMGTGIANAFEYLGPINEGNRNFAPLKQHQFEKQETLDFVNNPNEYKVKREKKDAYLNHQEEKQQINNNRPTQAPMEFTKGEDGQIRIQGIK